MFDDPLLEDPVLDDRSSWSSLSRKDSSDMLVSAVHQAPPLLEERPRHTSFMSSRKQSNDVTQASSFKSNRKQSTDSMCGMSSKSNRKQSNGKHRSRTSTADSTLSHEPRRQVKVSDHRLAELACHAASTIEWDTLRARSSVWDKKKNLGDFGVYTRRCGRSHQIMASGSVACSIAEMQHILCTTTTARYAAAMSELHGPSFLAGAVVHKINTRLLSDDPGRDDDNNGADDMGASTTASRTGDGCYNLTVKTATFAKAHLFARNEHWCFLDYFQPQSDKQKFVLSMHSLHPEDVLLPSVGTGATAGSSSAIKHGDTTQQAPTKLLQEVSTGYSVVADPRRKLVWVVFFAQFLEPATTGGGGGFFAKRERASKHAVMKRLMKMAKAACYLPMIVHRRRLGVQVLADQNAFTPPNTHCIVCTSAVLGLASKQRCNLCGYCVCDKCSNKHEVERAHTHLMPMSQRPSVRVCLTCARRVDGANYDSIPTGAASPSAVKRNAPNTAAPNITLASLLRDSFENAEDEHKKRAVIQVIKSLLDDSDEDTNNNCNDGDSNNYDDIDAYNNNNSECDTASISTSLSQSHIARSSSGDAALVDALATNLHVRAFELEECELGNATSRNYPLTFSDERDIDSAAFPVPANEESRLEHVRKRRLSDIKNVPELEIICSIARKEMGCATGLVTIIEQGEAHVVASSSAMFRNVIVPRDQSMCAHAVLSNKPLLVPHADADVRFNRIGAVQNGAFSYYVGFPLVMSDNSVIGTVCCLDSDDREVTQAQYSIMTKLAATAARVMEMRANANDAATNE